MIWLRQLRIDLRARVSALFARRHLHARVREEMQFHLDMRTAQLVEHGMTPEQASAQAEREFGHVLVLRERTAETWRYGGMDRLLQDLRYALRALARTPGFTLAAVLTLAIGIGANAAIFTLIDRLLLRPLPVRAPAELVLFDDEQSFPHYEYFRDRGGDLFRGVTAFTGLSRIAVDGGLDRGGFVEGRLVSGNYFDVLGVEPRLGRLLAAADDGAGAGSSAIVISHAFWRRHFDGDPAVVGRTVRLTPSTDTAARGGVFTIVGVAPPAFTGETVGEQADFWAPLAMQPHFLPGHQWLAGSSTSWLSVIARVAPGISRERAQAGLNVLLQRVMMDESGPVVTEDVRRLIAGETIALVDGDKGRSPLRSQARRPLMLLMGLVAVVLLVACANLANLLLARATARGRDVRVRLALGASRARLVGQLFAESALLGLFGLIGALAIGVWGARALFAMAANPATAPRLDIGLDPRTFAFIAAVAMATVLAFGLVPALRATRFDTRQSLAHGRRDGGHDSRRLSRGLVIAQVALSVVLLIGAGLFIRTLRNVQAQDLGYAAEQLVLMRVDPRGGGYEPGEIGRACAALLDAIRALPGVQAVTFSENGLFSGTESGTLVTIDGYQPADERARQVRFDQVGPGYFTSVGIPVIAGRDFTADDRVGAPRVAIINEQMARFYFGDRTPIGARIRPELSGEPQTLTVIGVTRDARDHDLRSELRRRMYVPFLQPISEPSGAKYLVRSSIASAALASQLRATVTRVEPRMPIETIAPVTTLVDETLRRERLLARLSLVLGLIATVLVCVGVHAVQTHAVARRTNEMGIRMAIGASRTHIVWSIVRETLWLAGCGALIGVPAALALGGFVEPLLFNVPPSHAGTIAVAVALIVLVALASTALPARRAATVDPLRALRAE